MLIGREADQQGKKRKAYSAQHNRFYVRGLPKHENKRHWERVLLRERPAVERQKYDRCKSPRIWNHEKKLVLVPPDAWSADKHNNRPVQSGFFDPDKAPPSVYVHGASLSTFHAAAQTLPRAAVMAIYAGHKQRRLEAEAERLAAATTRALPQNLARSGALGVERYVSSGNREPVEGRAPPPNDDLARAGPSGQPLHHERSSPTTWRNSGIGRAAAGAS